MKVSILIATCFRPKMLIDMLDSLARTTNWESGDVEMEAVFAIDEDLESFRIASNFFPEKATISYSPRLRGALNAWNKTLELSHGDVLIPAGDDQLFYPNWLDYALESLRDKLGGYGVVGMNDLAYDGNTQLATMFLFTRDYCKDHMGGILAMPCYKYFCIDSEINAKAKMLGKFWWDKRAVIEHLHVAHGKRVADQHDQLKVDNNWANVDNAMFEHRTILGYPVTWEPII